MDQVPFLIDTMFMAVLALQSPDECLGPLWAGGMGWSFSGYQLLKYCVPPLSSVPEHLEMQVNTDCHCGVVNLARVPRAGRSVLFSFPKAKYLSPPFFSQN